MRELRVHRTAPLVEAMSVLREKWSSRTLVVVDEILLHCEGYPREWADVSENRLRRVSADHCRAHSYHCTASM
jgi:hypothetical protein